MTKFMITGQTHEKLTSVSSFALYPADAVDQHLSFLLPPISTETTAGAAKVVFECIVATEVIGSR